MSVKQTIFTPGFYFIKFVDYIFRKLFITNSKYRVKWGKPISLLLNIHNFVKYQFFFNFFY
jgi:hypothetical protein